MAGPTGESIHALLARLPKLLGSNLLADPLLEGKPPEDLRAIHADLKNANKLVELVADKGVLVAAEVREPRPTLKGIGKAVGGLLSGKPGRAPPSCSSPRSRLTAVVPDVGERAETLFAALRLLMRQNNYPVEKLPADSAAPDSRSPCPMAASRSRRRGGSRGRTSSSTSAPSPSSRWSRDEGERLPGRADRPPAVPAVPPDGPGRRVRVGRRGYVDASRSSGWPSGWLGRSSGPDRARRRVWASANLQAVVFSSGFDGKESAGALRVRPARRAEGAGEGPQVAAALARRAAAMPPDVTRFSALRVDPAAVFDAGLG